MTERECLFHPRRLATNAKETTLRVTRGGIKFNCILLHYSEHDLYVFFLSATTFYAFSACAIKSVISSTFSSSKRFPTH